MNDSEKLIYQNQVRPNVGSSFHLPSKDSIEEKILHLQEKKKMIADDILEVDDNTIHKLNIDEIKNLFD